MLYTMDMVEGHSDDNEENYMVVLHCSVFRFSQVSDFIVTVVLLLEVFTFYSR